MFLELHYLKKIRDANDRVFIKVINTGRVENLEKEISTRNLPVITFINYNEVLISMVKKYTRAAVINYIFLLNS